MNMKDKDAPMNHKMKAKFDPQHKAEFDKPDEELTDEQVAAGFIVDVMQWLYFEHHGPKEQADQALVAMGSIIKGAEWRLMDFVQKNCACPQCEAKRN